jgi:hypothetical protein
MVQMKINPGTQPEAKMLLRGKGVKYLRQPSRRYAKNNDTRFAHVEFISMTEIPR